MMALRHCLLLKILDETVFFQRHDKLFDGTEIENSIQTLDKIISPRSASPPSQFISMKSPLALAFVSKT